MSVSKGAVLTVSMRWTDRLVGFVSTLILARLLLPEDFGIVAMASLAIGLIDVLLDLGVHVALIQNENATEAHYNSAWTLRLAQAAVAAGIACIGAPLVGEYFGDPRVEPVVQIMAAGLLLAGFENIGVVNFQKEMRFGLDFKFLFFKRLAGFIVTVVAAFFLRSYWALVLGSIVGRIFGVLLSYRMHPMRPRLSFEKMGEIFGVSQWMLIRSIVLYMDNNLHKILVGRRSVSMIMGGYTLADDISVMPSREMLSPLNRALFPAFVQAKSNLSELKRIFLLAQGVQTLIGVPASVGLSLVAYEAVLILLGEKWLLAVPFVQLLALSNVVQAITTSVGYVFLTVGRFREIAFLGAIQVVLFGLGAFLIVPDAGALQIAWIRVLTVLAGLSLTIWMLMRALENVRLLEVLFIIIRPLFGAGAMAIIVIFCGEMMSGLPTLSVLVVKIGIGLVAYPTTVMTAWWIMGRPEGAETYLVNKAMLILRRQKGTGFSSRDER